MGGTARRPPQWVKVILLCLLFPASCEVIFRISEGSLKVPVSAAVPTMFPMVVFTRETGVHRARLVYKKNLAGFLKNHPDYTFLVPRGQEFQLNTQLMQTSRSKTKPPDYNSDSPDPWEASFKVKQVSEDRQALEVEGTWDDDRLNKGWYEATEKQVSPKYHQSGLGPGIAMGAVFNNCLLWVGAWAVYAPNKRLKRKRASGQALPGAR